MKLFSALYERTLRYAGHRHAVWYLGGLSFMESSFFPVPPDVLLIPMCLAKPQRALFFALVTTLASVLGGLFGYLIGQFALEAVTPLLHDAGYWPVYEKARALFAEWGFWAVLAAGFSPIPYKIFTIAAGAAAMPLVPFVLASALSRGARFFLVAGLIRWGGEKMEATLRRHVEIAGWVCVALMVVALVIWRW
ncbi:MAG: DedA family protein [Rhodocyclaceae bacterium]|nr:DedA family protein [Rhodocyclaceae bacterium]